MPVACDACAQEVLDGGASCASCGSTRIKSFPSRAQLVAWQEDRAVHGRRVEREPLPPRFRFVVPFVLVLGVFFVIIGVAQSVAAAQAGLGAFGLATAAAAIGPLAWGVALLAFARHVWAKGGPA